MGSESSQIERLREVASMQGVYPTDEDLEGVRDFLDRIVPVLTELEDRLPPEAAP
jgi:hypothetical protein